MALGSFRQAFEAPTRLEQGIDDRMAIVHPHKKLVPRVWIF